MRSILVNTLTWILIACGAFYFVRGGLDYWESRSAQEQIAAEWSHDEASVSPAITSGATPESDYSEHPSSPETPARVAPAGRMFRPAEGRAVARLSIPRLDTVLYVVEGDDLNDLKRGPGHLTGSAMPGQPGNCVIAGHRDTHFRVLKNIQKGDEIDLARDGHSYRYVVDELSVVSPDNLAPLRPTREPVLNLITCYPFYYVGAAPRRFIVHAHLAEEALRASR